MGTKNEDQLDDSLDMENGFNDAMNDLRKSLGQSIPVLKKSKEKAKDEEEEEEEDDEEGYEEGEEDGGDDDEEEDDKDMKKSMEDRLREDPEAAAAMDVEPFLLQLAKSIDESMGVLTKRLLKVEAMTKSIGAATLASSELQKSTRDIVKTIGGTAVPSASVRSLAKSRFEGGKVEVDNREVLAKSRDWLKAGYIDLLEAGNLEGRINKNLLGKVQDRLDQKVATLIKEGK